MSRGLSLRAAIATLPAWLFAAPVAAQQWSQPARTKSVETMVCNKNNNDARDAHGLVCLSLDCAEGGQYRFTIIADLSMFGDTRFSAGGHSVVLKMEEQHSAELKGWNLSRASVSADFLKRIAREKQLQIRNLCEGCADVPLTLTKFSAELRRLGATCTEAS